jgi:hypothetical protein
MQKTNILHHIGYNTFFATFLSTAKEQEIKMANRYLCCGLGIGYI